MDLKGSSTEQNLKDAFAGESQANRRYLYFAAKADVEGYNDVAAVFRSTAEGETGHAHGHRQHDPRRIEQDGKEQTGEPAAYMHELARPLRLRLAETPPRLGRREQDDQDPGEDHRTDQVGARDHATTSSSTKRL